MSLVTVGPFQVGQRGPLRTSPVTGPLKRQVKLVNRALLAVDDDVPVNVMLNKPVAILFGFVKTIPGTNARAAGYTVGGPAELIRWGMPDSDNLSSESVIGTVLHEGLGHCYLALHKPDDAWMTRALALLTEGPPIPAFTDPSDVWKGAPGDDELAKKLHISEYWLRPYECLINDMVMALADGVTVSWSHKYRRHVAAADLPKLKSLWLELVSAQPAPPPPVPDEPIDDELPEPPDPCADLQARISVLRSALDAIHQLSASV
jgi:hypothetical protein